MVEVTKEDRDAAVEWEFIECRRCSEYGGGFVDDLASDFARHRIAAEQRGKLEGARLAIEEAADRLIHAPPHLSMSEYAGNIRAIDPAKIVGEG